MRNKRQEKYSYLSISLNVKRLILQVEEREFRLYLKFLDEILNEKGLERV